MGFLDKAKAAAGQAAAKAREVGDDLQLKRDLGQAYDTLGKAAFELIEAGELSHEKLEAPAARIRELEEQAAESERAEPGLQPEAEAPEAGDVAEEQAPTA